MNPILEAAKRKKARVSYYLPLDMIEYVADVAKLNDVPVGTAAEAILAEGIKTWKQKDREKTKIRTRRKKGNV